MLKRMLVLVAAAALITGIALFSRYAPAAELGAGEPVKPDVVKPPNGEERPLAGKEALEAVALRKRLVTEAARIMQRMGAGEQLTDAEEKNLARILQLVVDRRKAGNPQPPVRPVGAPPDERFNVPFGMPIPGEKPGQETPRRLRYDERLNVLDEAYYQIAEIHLAKRRYNDAVAAIEELIKKSPDPLAVSLSHLNLAEIYRKELGNPEKAIEEYKKVTGTYAVEAQERLASMFEELDKIDEAVEQFETIVKESKDPMQKVLALRKLAELLQRNGREEAAVEVLLRLVKAVPYDEAARISKLLLEDQERREKNEAKEQEAARVRMMRQFQRRVQPRKPDLGGEAVPLRPDAAGPPRKKKDAQPEERPIKPVPEREPVIEFENGVR